jgi:hypothetical protein
VSIAEKDKDRILLLISHQYVSLRNEICEHMRGLYVLCAAISTIIVAAFSAGFYLWSNTLTATCIFNLAIPTIIITGALGILTASNVAVRISQYIAMEIEKPVYILLGSEYEKWLNTINAGDALINNSKRILGWENSVCQFTEGKMIHKIVKQNIFMVGVLFSLVFLVSVAIGETSVFSSSLWEGINPLIRVVLGVAPWVLLIFGVITTTYQYRTTSRIYFQK